MKNSILIEGPREEDMSKEIVKDSQPRRKPGSRDWYVRSTSWLDGEVVILYFNLEFVLPEFIRMSYSKPLRRKPEYAVESIDWYGQQVTINQCSEAPRAYSLTLQIREEVFHSSRTCRVKGLSEEKIPPKSFDKRNKVILVDIEFVRIKLSNVMDPPFVEMLKIPMMIQHHWLMEHISREGVNQTIESKGARKAITHVWKCSKAFEVLVGVLELLE
ncbi:unnamed protein product [Linum trigynum]|uniref:Uncharacterized protein n=1 Tax=Linum trigynum TaxID=586398 RepID=A0AAV2E6I6_9ROSI